MYGTAGGLKDVIKATRISAAVGNDSDEFLELMLASASAELDAYLQIYYSVPIDTTSLDAGKKAALDAYLAQLEYGLTIRAVFSAGKDIPKAAMRYYDHQMKVLEQIKKGEVFLPYLERTYQKTFGMAGDTENSLSPTVFRTVRDVSYF